MAAPPYPPRLQERLSKDPKRSWRTWQLFEVGDLAIDLHSSLVVTIDAVNWNVPQVHALYPHGTLSLLDPEALVSLSDAVRFAAYKTWCLSVGRIDLWDLFSQAEAAMRANLPVVSEPPMAEAVDEDKINMLVDCGHMTAEPWRCSECQELLCQACRISHICFDLRGD